MALIYNSIISRLILVAIISISAPPVAAVAPNQSENPAGTENSAVATDPAPVAEMDEQEYLAWTREFLASLTPLTGETKLAGGIATLNVPEKFYYLSAADASRVLSEGWGNPPGQTTLGMIFPAGLTPLDPGSWGVNILYEEDGYVSDKNIGDLDFDAMLEILKADTRSDNDIRVAEGYDATELIGWAAAPRYDAENHKLYWAKELKFGSEEINTLNYDIRILGRRGVLLLNFVADMDQLAEIEAAMPTVLAMADFDQGHRYTDFDPEIDEVAAYGIGALVAGKILAKTGFLFIALAFLKKFGIVILVAAGAFITNLVRRKKEAE